MGAHKLSSCGLLCAAKRARKDGCPVAAEALGTDYNAAVRRAETILLPQFDVWRDGDDAAAHAGPTLDWVFAEYRADRRYTRLDVPPSELSPAFFGNRPTAFRKPPARRADRTLLFSTLSATAHVQPADKPSDHEHRHQENDDHARADEQIGENKTGALLDDHAARSRADSLLGSR